MNFSVSLFRTCFLLVLVQAVAALPWLSVAVFGPGQIGAWFGRLRAPQTFRREALRSLAILAVLVFLAALLALFLLFVQAREALEIYGRIYASLLHLQLGVDLFVGVVALMLFVWPKGGAVALAAFREGLRQPMFWLLLFIALFAMLFSPFIPYFTFGEDLVMVKELGYDTVMLAAALFGVLAASTSISEEIEGRTAMTVMSKPISRRQFLLGKYVGILLVALVMVMLLGWAFNWLVIFKRWYEDPTEPVPVPALVNQAVDALLAPGVAADFLRGIGRWVGDTAENLPGLILGSCQVMVLLSVAVALATRLPMISNMVICLAVYFVGHLSPVLAEIANRRLKASPGAAGNQMLDFMASLFHNLLPGMEFFSVGPALVTDAPPPLGEFYVYVGMVTVYGVLYTLILLLVGLVLFEDRDLA